MSYGGPTIDATLLVADVGGTNARLATFRHTDGRPEKVRERIWPSADLDGLVGVVEEYVSSEDHRPAGACLALAGPVENGTVRFPNLGWEVHRDDLARAAGITSLSILNDFDAIGHGVLLLREDERFTLQAGAPVEGAPVAVVGAGTGLGVAYLDPSTDPPRVHSTEGGHADFAPRDAVEWGLARYLRSKHGRASWERVLSGSGLADVYRYLADSGYAKERASVREEMEENDPAQVVSQHGLAHDDALCERAVELFVSVYGSLAGNVALGVGALGGVFIAGGIAPRLLEVLRAGPFLKSFLERGRLREYVAAIPVSVVLTGDVGLLGAASIAARSVDPTRA